MAAIETDDLRKEYGEVTALDDLDLVVETGEVFGFLGPNGAGKSTAISVLLGYVAPTAGTATVLGSDVTEHPAAVRAETGVLPENVGVYDRLTAREHVASAVRIQDATEEPATLLDRVGLARDAWDRPAGEFSTGMTQRLALATALVGDPDLLVLDEPQAGLDPNGRAAVRDLVREEARAGTTVFFSSHVVSEVATVADRVGVMRAGELVAADGVDTLRERLGGETVVAAELVDPAVDLGAVRNTSGVTAVDAVDGSTGPGTETETETDTETLEDAHVAVTCGTARTKARVVAQLEETAGVADFRVETGSLEASFATLTEGARAGERTADAVDETGGGGDPTDETGGTDDATSEVASDEVASATVAAGTEVSS
ncbi:ATP-binding cassette domain-containing protein [Halobaculum sp. MBLA0147]|uniref:ATP-binding cassette domain-containing protein n=1 Tax=Halobaculum sp. MBLA0147 TaxID=3079934 RepID=UPI0035240D93